MIRVPLRRLIPRPARARAMVATVRTPYQTATRRAPPRPAPVMITEGMSSPARTLRVLLLNASLSVAAARPRRARNTAATALGMLGDRGQDDGAGDHARHRPAGAERGCGALHGRAGRDDDGEREDGDGSVSRAALAGAAGMNPDRPGKPESLSAGIAQVSRHTAPQLAV